MIVLLWMLGIIVYLEIGYLLVNYATKNEKELNLFYVEYGSELIIIILAWPLIAILEYGGRIMDKVLNL